MLLTLTDVKWTKSGVWGKWLFTNRSGNPLPQNL